VTGGEYAFYRPAANLVAAMAYIKAGAREPRDDVAGAWFDCKPANCGDESLGFTSDPFDRTNPFRGCGQSIAAKLHGGGASVVRLAGEGKRAARLTGNGINCGQRLIQSIENRTLLNMKFQVPKCVLIGARFRNADRLEPEGAGFISVQIAYERSASDKRSANLTPSSSENPITSISKGNLRPFRSSTRATPITTPSTPSKAPARGTVSRCEPI
jgi:hypothetical protein